MQHPSSDNCGKERSVNVIDENIAKLRRVQDLPDYYTSVQPVVLKNSNPVVPKLIGPVMPPLDDNVSSLPKELDWLNNVKSLCGKNELSHEDFMSWAASHASLQSSPVQQVDIVALLPLSLEISHSSAMIRHGMNVVNDVVQHLNPGQTPVIAMDQPLFALAKLIQWNMPETQGEDRSVQNIKKIGQSQYKAFVSERMVERTKPITHPIKRNKLPLFSRPTTKTVSKKQAQVSALKDDCSLFSRLYISCQTREGDLEEFFKHENQPWPPSLSQHGQLRQGNKAELVRCLQGTTEASAESPQVDVKVFDGAVVVQMLHPKTVRTFQEHTQTVFLPYIQAQLQSSQRLDIV